MNKIISILDLYKKIQGTKLWTIKIDEKDIMKM